MTEMFLPASTAPRMTPSAVPYPAVASAPALQWVITVSPSSISAAPWRPMARLVSMSSRWMRRASDSHSETSVAKGACPAVFHTLRMRSTAQRRFTAVGRAAAMRPSRPSSTGCQWSPASAAS